MIVLAGALDMGANIAFLLATRAGMLSISAAVAALYPAPTVILAWVILREKVTAARLVGLALALAGVALISSALGWTRTCFLRAHGNDQDDPDDAQKTADGDPAPVTGHLSIGKHVHPLQQPDRSDHEKKYPYDDENQFHGYASDVQEAPAFLPGAPKILLSPCTGEGIHFPHEGKSGSLRAPCAQFPVRDSAPPRTSRPYRLPRMTLQ